MSSFCYCFESRTTRAYLRQPQAFAGVFRYPDSPELPISTFSHPSLELCTIEESAPGFIAGELHKNGTYQPWFSFSVWLFTLGSGGSCEFGLLPLRNPHRASNFLVLDGVRYSDGVRRHGCDLIESLRGGLDGLPAF